ncbi:NERD domain-containing protein [Metamycoplasma hominis]|uniref:nuclease-related domain-containing protein n=2 Tax=Metamycoplasma hominis TaxID=2098 RepID=UPI000EAB8821|nr:nuclease-related domain-containing protein [Metamycoplasma hominis]AYK04380.1 NERD domain-containing protein [Metamycoplasma hominis]QKX39734.1 NERD domain-containing protein [Metamycoplasma hominis]
MKILLIIILCVLIIPIFIGVVCMFFIKKRTILKEKNFKKELGDKGEQEVIKILQKMNAKKYLVLNDIRLMGEGGKRKQIDHIVVSSKGIFVIETKNWKGDIVGSKNEKYLEVVAKYGDDRVRKWFKNPIFQNKAHIEALNSILSKSINEEINYYSIIVFVNKNKIYFRNDESEYTEKKLYFKEKIFLIHLDEVLRTIYRCINNKAYKKTAKSLNIKLIENIIHEAKTKEK